MRLRNGIANTALLPRAALCVSLVSNWCRSLAFIVRYDKPLFTPVQAYTVSEVRWPTVNWSRKRKTVGSQFWEDSSQIHDVSYSKKCLPFSLLSIYLLQNYSSSSSSPMHLEVADESGGDTRTVYISSLLMAPSLLMRMRKIAFVIVGFFFKHGLIFSRMRFFSYHH